jgi:hypothetical protein
MSNGTVPTSGQRFRIRFLPAIPGSNAAASAAAAAASAAAAQTAANTAVAATASKVNKAGDTMTGFLILNADPMIALHAASKQYVDAHGGGGGGGNMSTSGAPVAGQLGMFTDPTHMTGLIVGAALSASGGTLNVIAAGGNVMNSGTPVAGQLARWTSSTLIQGVDASSLGFQPLSADLTSLAAASASGIGPSPSGLYYRKATNTWAPLNLVNLTIDGTTDTISAAGGTGGGNVSSIGTPTSGQLAQWTSGTQIQGITSITNALLSPVVAPMFKGRTTAGTGALEDLTPTQATALLNPLVGDAGSGGTKGLAPAPAAGDAAAAKFLKADATWAVPVAGGNVSNVGTPLANQFAQWTDATHIQGITAATATAALNTLIGANGVAGVKGLAPAPAAGDAAAGKFLKADATWAVPPGGGAGLTISDTPPASPTVGMLWWQSSTGILWLYYTDINSSQWVAVSSVPGGAATAAPPILNYLGGLTLSNDVTSPNTVLDIATGTACSDDNTTMMALSTVITKNCNAAWAVGSGNGGLDTGSTLAASIWYHVFLIERIDTGVVDVLISTSATAPTLPTSYTRKRRIGSIFADTSAHILAFTQLGDQFLWTVPILSIGGTSAIGTTPGLINVPAPAGVKTTAWLSCYWSPNISSILTIQSPDQPMTAAFIPAGNVTAASQAAPALSGGDFFVRTNTSNQVQIAANSAVTGGLSLVSRGWVDNRGK